MSLPNLHPEILEEIAEILQDTHTESLRPFSLVCSAVRRPAQRLLFQSITLSVSTESTPSPYNPLTPPVHHIRLRDILKANPALATYIREVKCLQLENSLASRFFGIDTTPKQWILDHGQLLGEILQLLDSSPLQSFSIENFVYTSPLDWSQFHPTLVMALLHVFHKSRLTSVQLSGLSLPQNIFSALPNLKYLVIGNSTWLPDSPVILPASHLPAQSQSGQHLCQLSSLRMVISSVVNTPLDSIGRQVGLDLTRIRSLHLDLSIVPNSSLTRFISLPHLTDLTITHPPHGHADHTFHVDLGAAVGLRTLTILYGLLDINPEEFLWISPTLSSLPSRTPIEIFQFKINQNLALVNANILEPFKLISIALSSFHRRFPDLKQIRFDFKFLHAWQRFPALEKRFRDGVRDRVVWAGCEDVLMLDIGGIAAV
ncbi:hypothetical protein BDN72DRAFT_899501 [Pluteus cervinus]|uniref:Uncharacterized protein n=1 Tax=Pluteus cervinus TaxID=181527 RepID=A0ACD3AME3_9AGAR|nr:hypothetical protein BDN72DRAFT_899501 [Pluteus cervinus]